MNIRKLFSKGFVIYFLFAAYLSLKVLFWYEEWIDKTARYNFLKKNRYKISWHRLNKCKYHEENSTI